MKISKIFSGALLVSGTTIGAGMLALPVTTALGGFMPACLLYLVCWLFMAGTGLLLLEVSLWLPHDANMVSMARHLLGRPGKVLSWVLYLFLFYCLTIAYIAGGGSFVAALFGNQLSPGVGVFIFTLVFSPIVYFGTRAVDRVNLLLILGLIVSYFVFVLIGSKNVHLEFLQRVDWGASLFALPIVFTSFSFQGIVPSLITYLNRDVKAVRKAILVGTAIPFVAYVIWELLILGIVPLEGNNGLLSAQSHGLSAIIPLKHFVSSPYTYVIGQAFAFFALTTSFLGVTLGLMDFLADSLKIKKTGAKKAFLFCAVFVPPLLIALANPHIFLSALTYAGGFGCALLLGLFPVLMVWVGRYVKGSQQPAQLPGGRALLLLFIAFVCFELIIEIANLITF